MTVKNKSCVCSCQSETKLIFPCSGAADVGELADKIGRVLTKEGSGKMYCLAGIGGDVSGIIESTKSATKILAIDGCPVLCAKKTLEAKGISNFSHITVTEHGFVKGKTQVNDESVNKILTLCRDLL